MKTCSRCKQTKPKSDFCKDARSTDGLNHKCRVCGNEAARIWREANPNKIRANGRKWRANNQVSIREKDRERYAKNPERKRRNNRKYYSAHAEKCRAGCQRYRTTNHTKVIEQKRKHYAEHREQTRNARLKKSYGITTDVYNNMLAKQNGGCANCGAKPFSDRIPGANIPIDHNHTTGEIRGLLCQSCNIALGLLDENPEWIAGLIAYLKAHQPANL